MIVNIEEQTIITVSQMIQLDFTQVTMSSCDVCTSMYALNAAYEAHKSIINESKWV